jgi:hypothetical protein
MPDKDVKVWLLLTTLMFYVRYNELIIRKVTQKNEICSSNDH